MKRFKELYHKALQEEYTEGGSVFNGYSDSVRRTAQSDFGVHRVGEGDSIHRLNAFIAKFLGGTYIDPEAAVNELRGRLNHAGLDFVFDGKKISLHPGINSFPAKLYGEVFGTTPTTDLSKGFDKGMDLPGLNLVIDVTYDETSCMYGMTGKLIPTPKSMPLSKMHEESEDLNEYAAIIARVLPIIARVASNVGKGVASNVGKSVGTDIVNGGIEALANASSGGIEGIIGGAKTLINKFTSAMDNYPSPQGGQENTQPMGEDGTITKIPRKKSKRSQPMNECENCSEDELSEETKKHQSDLPRKVEHFIMRDKNMKDKVLMPVYNHLLQKKKKGKLTLDDARKELYFVVNSAVRRMKTDKGGTIILTQSEKSRVVNDLVRNFKKYSSQKYKVST